MFINYLFGCVLHVLSSLNDIPSSLYSFHAAVATISGGSAVLPLILSAATRNVSPTLFCGVGGAFRPSRRDKRQQYRYLYYADKRVAANWEAFRNAAPL